MQAIIIFKREHIFNNRNQPKKAIKKSRSQRLVDSPSAGSPSVVRHSSPRPAKYLQQNAEFAARAAVCAHALQLLTRGLEQQLGDKRGGRHTQTTIDGVCRGGQ